MTRMTHVVVLDHGETIASERVLEAMATTVLGALHFAYEQGREGGGGPPPAWSSVWDDYVATIEATPPEQRHLRIHVGHSTFVDERERRFVTPQTIAASGALVGEPDELVERIARIEA
jgi:hypothetical protein